MIAGAAMLAWCALLLADASLSQRFARQSLETTLDQKTPVAPRASIETAGVATQVPLVRRGAAIADLSIPRLELSSVVLHGSDAQTLRRGPGHIENTALPGESGNVVIAGHRDSFFRPLRHVRLGDDIFMATPQGRFHYRVTSLRVVNPHDLSVLEPTDEATLTLITCYPFWVLGNAPDRFIVRATRVDDPAATAIATQTTSPPEPIRTPVDEGTAANTPVVLNAPARDDETLVRETIERFRLTYNARLISHNDMRPGGPLRFQTCDVAIDGEWAAATCGASPPMPDGREPPIWSATLARAHGGWAIRSILMN